MRSRNRYVLVVYAVFIIELLTNILFMGIFESIYKCNQATLDDIGFDLKIVGLWLIPLLVFRFCIDILLKKFKPNIGLIIFYLISVLGLCIFYGALLAIGDGIGKAVGSATGITEFYNVVPYTFYITILIFIGMTIWGFFTRRKDYNHPILNNIFISSFMVSIFNIFWGWNWLNIIIDIVDLVTVSLFIYFDTIKIKQHAKELMLIDKKEKLLNILNDATGIYEDFIFIWVDLISLAEESDD